MYTFYQIKDIHNLLTLFIISGYQILSNAFSASIEMIIFFLSFYLNVVDYIDFFNGPGAV